MSRELRSASSVSVSDQANVWFARLQADDVSDEERQRFEVWYRASSAHAEAYEKNRKLWSLLQFPAERVHSRIKKEEQHRDATVPPDSSATKNVLKPAKFNHTVRYWVGMSCLSLLLILVGRQMPALLQDWRSDYHTVSGRQMSVALEDGSRLTLNTDTALTIQFSDAERRIELLRGEAYFEVAPNKARPFIVDGGNAEAKAVGTAFSVSNASDTTRVSVAEGTVQVRVEQSTTLVHAEQQVDVVQRRILPVLSVVNDDTFAWRRGQLVFSKQALDEVLAEVNRYRRSRIVAVNSALASRIVSGVFNIGDPDAVVDALQATLHAQRFDLPGGLVLLY